MDRTPDACSLSLSSALLLKTRDKGIGTVGGPSARVALPSRCSRKGSKKKKKWGPGEKIIIAKID